jgi:ATP phosphoribosyltransferase regulatory subunit
LVKKHNIKEHLKEIILSLPKLFGSVDVIEKVEKYSINERCMDALENLRRIIEILEDYGLSKYVSIDLGMVQSVNYYTGIIFRGFTYGIGFPILSGGRYDGLVEKFGKGAPATGFSLGINMIMMALDRQKIKREELKTDSLICYQLKGRKNAFSICDALRKQGLNIEVDITGRSLEDIKKYAKNKGIGGILYVLDEENIEVHNLEKEEVKKVTVKELLES